MDNTKNHDTLNEVKYEDTFDFTELVNRFWLQKNYLIFFTAIISIFSLIYVLSLPTVYSSNALLKVVDESSQIGSSGFSGLTSSYSRIASVAGVSLPSESADKANLVIATIKSRDFLLHLLTFSGVLSNFIAIESYDLKTSKINYDINLYDQKQDSWPNGRPSFYDIYKLYTETLIVSQDQNTKFLYIEFTSRSPEFSHDFISLIINEINAKIRNKNIEESSMSLSFLNTAMNEAKSLDVKNSLSFLMQSQIKVQMLANARKDYIVEPVDSPFIPDRKSGPAILEFITLSTLAGLLIILFFVSVKFYFYDKKVS